MAYTDAGRVNERLKRVLDADQLAEAARLAPVAQERIDGYLGRTYEVAIADEAYVLDGGPDLFLRSTPVTAVTALKRWDQGTHALITLTQNVDYEIRDLNLGLVRLLAWGTVDAVTWTWPDEWPFARSTDWPAPRLWASYTAGAVPELVKLAATELVIDWLGPTRDPSISAVGSSGAIKSYSVGQDLSVTFQDAASASSAAGASAPTLPDNVLALLAPLRKVVFA